MDQKTITNRQKSRSGGLRCRFGGVLGRLGRSKASLDASWTVLEASWKRLGGLLGGLGPRKVANMAPTWPPKENQNQLNIDPKIDQSFSASWNRVRKDFGCQNGAKLEAQIDQKSIKTLMFFLIGFLSDFFRFWVPKWSQVGTRMGWKIDVNLKKADFL